MNIFDLFSLNRHGAYREVLFSSVLSYVLNPQFDHGMKAALLSDLINRLMILPPDYDLNERARVTSEKCLDEEAEDDDSYGDIDIIVEAPDFVVGIELKIWDRSGENTSASGKKQLIRYAEAIQHMAEKGEKQKQWRLLFIVPRLAGKVCSEEFTALFQKPEFGQHCFIMPLMKVDTQDEVNALASATDAANIITLSLEELLRSKLSQDGLLHDRTTWLLASYVEFLERRVLIKPNPDPQKFPSLQDLSENEECAQYLELLAPFMNNEKRYPNARHTVIGVPFGRKGKRSGFHGNCLYRVRTTEDYYDYLEEKDEFLPKKGELNIELWVDVYNHCATRLAEWLSEGSRGTLRQELVGHLNRDHLPMVRLLTIKRVWMPEEVSVFRGILEEGFRGSLAVSEVRKKR